ncbi:MAG: response regulator [Elusimicrobiota bacterium]|nr:response regulator [Elusimicrobiota bacterium]
MKDILVIDDEPVITAAVTRICEAEGLSVDTASSSAAGLALLSRTAYRLVLCDVMMSDVDGFALLAEAARRGLSAPVVMMTGYATLDNAVRALASGAADFIAKPFTADELLAVARRALRGVPDYVPCPPSYYRLGGVSWVKEEAGGIVQVGLSDQFLKTIDGLAALELAPLNEEAAQGGTCATVVTASGDRHGVASPVSGRIVEVNPAATNPAAVEKDPYFGGWLYRMLPLDLPSDLKSLVSCSSDRL